MVGGGIFLGIIILEVSHLELNVLMEEFLIGFSPYKGFSLDVRLHIMSLVLVIFIHI